MSRLNRYVFRQLFWTTVLVLISLTCVVWLIQSLRFVEMIVNRGLSAPLFIYFTALLLPNFVAILLPIALFIAVMFTFNRLTMDSELVVMRASGLSQQSLAAPALALAGLCTLVGYALSLYLLPTTYHEFKETQFQIRDTYTSVLLQEGVFNTLMKDVTVYVRARTTDGELLGIIVHDGRAPERPVTMMADRGALVQGADGPRVLMFNGNRQEISRDTGKMSILYFDQYVFDVRSLGETPEERWREPRERFIDELFLPMAEAATAFNFNKLRMEGHNRLSFPLMPLAVTLVGVACLLTGEFNRRGQLRRIVVAIALVVAMQAAAVSIKSTGEKMLDIAPLLYANVIVPILFGGFALIATGRWRRRSRQPAHEPA